MPSHKDDKKKKPKFKVVPRKKKEEDTMKKEKKEQAKQTEKPKPKKIKFKVVPRKIKEEEKKPEKKRPEQPKRKAPERKKPEKPTRAPPERKSRGKAPTGMPPAQRQKLFLKHGGSSNTKGETDLLSYGRPKPTPREIARKVGSRAEFDYVVGRLGSMHGDLGKKYSGDEFYGKRKVKSSGNFKMLKEVYLGRYAGGSKRTNGGSRVYIDEKTGAVYDNEKDFNEGDIAGKVITISKGRGKRKMKGIEIMYEDARNDIWGKDFGVASYGFDYGYVGEQGRLEDVLKGLKKSKDGFDFIPKLNLDLLD